MDTLLASRLRLALGIVAGLGILACALVAAWTWDGGALGSLAWWKVCLDLLVLAAGASLALWLSARGARLVAIPLALLVLMWGWFGTWAYGFSWVPGLCALVAAVLPTGQAAHGPGALPA